MRILISAILLSITPILFIFFGYRAFFNHDSLHVYINYKYVFDAFIATNELPIWNPYLSYGVSTSLSSLNISAVNYLTIIFAKILNYKNSLFFFNLSIILNTFLYLSGIILILKRCKIKEDAIFFSVFIASISLNPISQYYFDFDLIVKIPLLIYSLLYLFEDIYKRIPFFILFQMAITAGISGYFLVIYLYLGIAIFLVALLSKKIKANKNFSSICIRQKIIASVAISLSLFLLINYFINFYDVFHNFKIISPGRGENGILTFETFINYGGFNGPEKLINFIGGPPVSTDFDLFLGFVPIILSIYSLINLRNLTVKNQTIAQILLVIFTCLIFFTHPFENSLFHKILYHFPGMNTVRHISYFITITKPILIILSGIGFHLLSNDLMKSEIFKREKILCALALFFFTLIFLLKRIYFDLFLLTIFAILCNIVIRKNKKQNLLLFFCFFSFTDILYHRFHDFPHQFYQYNASKFESINNSNFPFVDRIDPKNSKKITIFYDSFYDDINPKDTNITKEVRERFSKTALSSGFARYSSEITLLKEDFCYQIFRQDYLLRVIYDTLKVDKLNFNPSVIEFDLKKTDDITNWTKYGCNRNKVELLTPDFFTNIPYNSNFNLAKNNYKNVPNRITSDSINITSFSPNQVAFKIDNKYNATLPLVYYDAFHPYWNGLIDGKKTKIYKINSGFKGLYIPRGIHNITFQIKEFYKYLELTKAAILSILILLLFCLCINNIYTKNCHKN